MLLLRRTTTLIAMGLLTGTPVVLASGTYPPAPPRLRSDVTQSIDSVAYNLGKSIYTGRASIKSTPSPDSTRISHTRERLESVVGHIPERAQSQLDVPALARDLNQESVDALLYYLRLRFRVTEGKA
ncbi:hypothetical protein [Synoicihabitans lomoniglobus]|uniref:Uncharacterized protein n=1 Tax=Synoicihabitans lomoniglobus TaxID=2909285 RepID=A0AAE9ZWP0_9BACT|nr:hypothetical protein [Opitutaceae bacterium LMO-M01]WED65532.1 hypothetical protein PXH66_01545 [Opitutaceae bacterium LMO-M01]